MEKPIRPEVKPVNRNRWLNPLHAGGLRPTLDLNGFVACEDRDRRPWMSCTQAVTAQDRAGIQFYERQRKFTLSDAELLNGVRYSSLVRDEINFRAAEANKLMGIAIKSEKKRRGVLTGDERIIQEVLSVLLFGSSTTGSIKSDLGWPYDQLSLRDMKCVLLTMEDRGLLEGTDGRTYWKSTL